MSKFSRNLIFFLHLHNSVWNYFILQQLLTKCYKNILYSGRSALSGGTKFSFKRSNIYKNSLQAFDSTLPVSVDNFSGMRETVLLAKIYAIKKKKENKIKNWLEIFL